VQSCVRGLADRSIYVALSWTQVAELFRHENDGVFYDRFKFLSSLPHIAWVRPYYRHWFPGSHVDVLLRELHAFKYAVNRSWRCLVDEVRSEFWETGTGSEMFGPNLHFWEVMRREYQYEQWRETTVASISRVDHGVNAIKLANVRKKLADSHDDWPLKANRLANDMRAQIQAHGDRRFENATDFSKKFALNTIQELESIRASGADLVDGILESTGVPRAAIRPGHTIGDLGDMAVYVERLRLLCPHLTVPCEPDIFEVPMDALPSYEFQRLLSNLQAKANRVSGSDIGDSYVAALAFYADLTEIDKRTFDYVERVKRENVMIRENIGTLLKSGDYEMLIDRIDLRSAA
jgi:hypothetical protein